MSELNIGKMNGHAVGIIMKEMVRRALNFIRGQRFAYEIQAKDGYGGGIMDDMFTSADTGAQKLYVKSIDECFPDVGIIGEEDGLKKDPQDGCEAYFTIDPLDGTKAFVRGQSHGVGSMIALVNRGVVIASYIGDVNTQEIYGYRPGSDRVHRISQFQVAETMGFGEKLPLNRQYVLLRDRESEYSLESKGLIESKFKNIIVDGGSIGIWLARLWKREVGAAIIPAGFETPWDSTPVIGISKALGYTFLKPCPMTSAWTEFDPGIPKETFRRTHDLLIVHKEDLGDLDLHFWSKE